MSKFAGSSFSVCDLCDCSIPAEERLQRKTTRRTKQTPEQRQARLEARRNKPVSSMNTCILILNYDLKSFSDSVDPSLLVTHT
jgi:guanylate kinase